MQGHPNSMAVVTCDEFASSYCSDEPAPFANVGSQEKFLRAQPDGTAVAHFFPYEKPARLQSFLTERLGPIPPGSRCNVSPEGSLALSGSVKAELRRRHAAVFTLYDSVLRAT